MTLSAESDAAGALQFIRTLTAGGRRMCVLLTDSIFAGSQRVPAAFLPSAASMDDGEDEVGVNCGRCGKKLLVRVEDILDKFTIDCDECERGRQASHDGRSEAEPLRPESPVRSAAFAFRQAIVFDASAPGLRARQLTASRDRIRSQ
jgi:hypothetical protein